MTKSYLFWKKANLFTLQAEFKQFILEHYGVSFESFCKHKYYDYSVPELRGDEEKSNLPFRQVRRERR